MKNKILNILVIIFFVFSVFLFVFFLVDKNKKPDFSDGGGIKNKIEIISASEKSKLGLYNLGVYQVLSRNEKNNISSYKLLEIKEEQPLVLELMSDEEKNQRGFNKAIKIQVLQRDELNNIIAYKIIKNDSDIVTKY
jgi:hypothetical protein